MASIKQYQEKLRMLSDFKKVVNIEKIVVMREIAELKSFIDQLEFRDALFNNLLIDLYKKHNTLDRGYFSSKSTRAPIKRTLWFVMSSKSNNDLGSYSNKLIIEHFKKHAGEKDLFVVIGKKLAFTLKENDFKVINTMSLDTNGDDKIYESIAMQVIRSFEDLLFSKAKFVFFDISSRNINETLLFPFENKKRDIDGMNKNFPDETLIMKGIKLGRASWLRDINSVSNNIAIFGVREKAFYVVTKYKLDSKLRELQSLDDKEKNIGVESEIVRIKMQRVRQESVTNELLTNAVAFSVINDEEASDG